ncbi:dihydropteroate synthase [Prochlorothrix hollandica]|uniref:Dihydropteroate synthase n=1 Tax=Prochlorothrix hollandica PCC 9006 = CALU 1027 TaxID=317619 RepID=A0A0M2PQ36_PROHO|nr:dihydropteroate synthase [Prochlorothrix hollandica]KKI98344.1 dihydropteroate synthase [Prochlorothrix hollandica PCC 9006 = CALU 1027]
MAESLTTRDRVFNWGDRTYVMGILNVTPDSFSDGGEFDQGDRALAQAQALVAGGVDIVDIGGQSSRPGAVDIGLEAELERVIPVITALRRGGLGLPISVDTTRSAVAAAALAAGADWINDISGGTFEPEILAVAAQYHAPVVLMHLRGTPQTMQTLTDYEDLLGEISQFFQTQVAAAVAAGVSPDRIILDPGIGFAKTYDQNLEIFQGLPRLKALGYPLLVGPSRKSFIGQILQQPNPKERVWGTAAACCGAITGGADLVRVHDGAEMVQVCRVADALAGRGR